MENKRGRWYLNQKISKRVYKLVTIDNSEIGDIHNKGFTCSKKIADKWNNNQPKNSRWSHGYEEIELND